MDNYNISILCNVEIINNNITPIAIKNINFNEVSSFNGFDYNIISPNSCVKRHVEIDFDMTDEVFEYISENYEERLKMWSYYDDPTRESNKMQDYIDNRNALISTLVSEYYINNKPDCNIELYTQFNTQKTYRKDVKIWKGDMKE